MSGLTGRNLCWLFVAAISCPSAAARAAGPIAFEDVTRQTGLAEWLEGPKSSDDPEGRPWRYAHGAGWGDVDGDGRPDLYLGTFEPEAPRAGTDRRPNVLLILADDLNAALGCYGHPLVKTPHIDRLAERGVLFERAYCQYPLCHPARVSLLTGLRPETSGVVDNNAPLFRKSHPDLLTLPQLFRRSGYRTMRVGKVFHQGVPEDVVAGRAGVDDPASWDVTVNPKGREHHSDGEGRNLTPQFDAVRNSSSACRWIAVEGEGEDQTDHIAATRAIRLLEMHGRQPFFLAVGFVRPHVPWVAPRQYFDLYPLDAIEPAHNPPDDRGDIPEMALKGRGRASHLGMSAERQREALRAYYACTSFVDAQVGRLTAALERLELAESTIVVFLGDHGYHLGEHELWQKRSLFEEATRTPLMISVPGSATKNSAGRRCRAVIELIDLYPTLAELAGLQAPADIQGRSLVPLLEDPSGDWVGAALTELWDGRVTGRSLRTDRWRYTQWEGREGVLAEELYDHGRDPREHTNLAADREHAAALHELRERLARIRGGAPGRSHAAP